MVSCVTQAKEDEFMNLKIGFIPAVAITILI
jgi:hypothetical protein